MITTILPLPEDQATWGNLELMFATRLGRVRRNPLADFENINRNGKIAMKFGDAEGDEADDEKAKAEAAALDEEADEEAATAADRIIGVSICSTSDDVMLTSAAGPGHPVLCVRRARLPQPRFDRRARHPAGRR